MPDLARARRDARDRRRRGDRALPARGRAVHAARAARDVRRADARAAAPPPRRGRARRPRLRRDLHAEPAARRRHARWKLPEPISVELHRAAHDARSRASSRPRGATSTRAPRDRAVRDRARLPAERRPAGRARCASAGIAEGGFLHAKGVVEALYAALQGRARASSAPTHPLLHPGQVARTVAGGWVGELAPARCSRASGARSSSTSASCSRACREPVTYQDVITFPAVRQDIAFAVRRGRRGRRARRGRARGGGRGAARDPRLRRLPRRAGRRGTQVGRVLGRLPVGRADARRGGRRRLREAIVAALAERFGAELRAGQSDPTTDA